MSEATVTAVSVAYRSRHTLPDTLAEARRAHDAGILECIVVDNASGDGTLDYLAESEPWVERIASPANLGFGRGCNLAFSRVGTRYVLLLNPDAVLPLEDLRRLIAFLDSHPEAGMVAPAIRYPDGSLQHAGGLPTPGSLVCTALGRPPAPRRIIQPGEPAFATDWLCGAVLLVRKSVLDELGGFDPRFFLYFEETDLCRRAQGHGHRLFALGEAVASHLHAASARTTGAALYSGCIADHYFPSRFYYLTKHFGVLRAVAAELGELGILLARIGSARLRGRSAPELAVRLRSPLLRRPRAGRLLMRLRVLPGRELSSDLAEAWVRIQEADPELGSPYLRPEFTQAVAAVRPDVWCSVLEAGGEAAGFFPFERGRLGIGRPVGSRLSDCQAAVVRPGLDWSAEELLRASGLSLFDFDHLLASQERFRPYHHGLAHSPTVELGEGFARWREARRRETQRIRQVERNARRLEREAGSLRFEADSRDPEVLRQVVAWKSAQCRRTGSFDFFGRLPWTVALVERLHATRTRGFAGVLSALWAGEQLVAAHFGMRTRSTWHWWFPAYATAWQRYSPGSVLLLRLIEAAAAHGTRCVDLGKGDDAYKGSYANGAVPLAEGCVALPSSAARLRRLQAAALHWLGHSPGGGTALRVGRAGRRLARRLRQGAAGVGP